MTVRIQEPDAYYDRLDASGLADKKLYFCVRWWVEWWTRQDYPLSDMQDQWNLVQDLPPPLVHQTIRAVYSLRHRGPAL